MEGCLAVGVEAVGGGADIVAGHKVVVAREGLPLDAAGHDGTDVTSWHSRREAIHHRLEAPVVLMIRRHPLCSVLYITAKEDEQCCCWLSVGHLDDGVVGAL